MRKFLTTCLLGLALATTLSAAPGRFELREGDRVAFLGDTFIEREQHSGYIELALRAQFPQRQVTFRNLGWSGDTPQGTSRAGLSLLQAGHEPADEGWRQLLAQIKLVKPNVVFLGYGMANSFDGEAGLPQFRQDMGKLMDEIQKIAGAEPVRFVLIAPFRHENLGGRLPDPTAHNAQLGLYNDALSQIASQRNAWFVSLFDHLPIKTVKPSGHPLTDNGIHLNPEGYQRAAEVIVTDLGLNPKALKKVRRAEAVRRAILKKNELFFNRSRPQNMAYLLGFRKHEQGKNAGEIPQFDPLIDATETDIHNILLGELAETAPLQLRHTVLEDAGTQPIPEFDIAPEMELTLYAESPLLAKPVQMNFDALGRLWVASSAVYPQIEPGEKADDKIVILEDTNRDGKADKSTTFVDGLFIPSTVLPGDGGVYVGQSTELLHFRDTNGDGKADERRVVLSSFGTEDTHHTVHTLDWGMDGNLYFKQSIYIRTDAETPHGVVRLRSGGTFQLKPAEMSMDIVSRGPCNPWGQAFDIYGQSFFTDGCGSQGISFTIRDATYLTYAKMRRELQSVSPGSHPKYCGLAIVRSQQFPENWQNSFITCDFRAHRIVRFEMQESGAGYVTKLMPDVLRTTNVAFRPIDVKLGPDGALYIADWANPIINHGEVDFRDPRRDHVHGRIWRLAAKGRPALPWPNLAKAKNKDLLDNLLSPNDYNRNQSRRLLIERGPKITKDLNHWTVAQTDERAHLEALWLYQALGQTNVPLLKVLLNAQDGRIRAAAVHVLDVWQDGMPEAENLLADKIKDPHLRVRLEVARALARQPLLRRAALVLKIADEPMDNFLDYAVWLSINDLSKVWADGVRSGAWSPRGREKQLEFALKAIEPSLSNPILAKLVKDRAIPLDGSGPWFDLIGQSGGAAELRPLFAKLINQELKDKAAFRAVNVLNDAARQRNVKPIFTEAEQARLLALKDDALQNSLRKLAGAWKLEPAVDGLLAALGDTTLTAEQRATVLQSLREIGGQKVTAGLSNLAETVTDPAQRRELVLTLGGMNLDQALPSLVKLLTTTTNDADATALWRSVLGIKDAGTKVAKLLPADYDKATAAAALKVAREGGRNEPDLVTTLQNLAGIAKKSDQELTTDELKVMAETVLKKGDPARGEKIYRRLELNCVGCHAIGGAGGKVGPDLTSIGASAPLDYLLESVLYPSRKIKEGYHSVQLQTKDEMELSGIILRESDTQITLRDSAGKETTVPKNNIASRKAGLSLMPSGLVDALSEEEQWDLYRFLAEIGKPGPFDATKGNIARAWKVFASPADTSAPPQAKLTAADLAVPGWTTAYTLVSGTMEKPVLAGLSSPSRDSHVFVAARLEVSSAAKVTFKITGASANELWLDGKPAKDLSGDFAQGKHTVVLQLNPRDLPAALRVEASEGTFTLE